MKKVDEEQPDQPRKMKNKNKGKDNQGKWSSERKEKKQLSEDTKRRTPSYMGEGNRSYDSKLRELFGVEDLKLQVYFKDEQIG